MLLTVAIKALNEEANIGRALDSAIRAAEPFVGEVILSDSGSGDQTVAIASQRPVKIVQLLNSSDRSCGAGAQLAYQHAAGKYLYLMDADMVLQAEFIEAAIRYLDQHAEVAGVGGMLREQNTEGKQYQILAKSLRVDRDWLPGQVSRLDGGGLYRVSAINDVGYFADRNLHAFEEFELAARLRTHGWTLVRLDLHAVDHFGHQVSSYKLLWRRLRNGYAGGAGEVLRAAIGQSHLGTVLRELKHIRLAFVVALWWVLLILSTVAAVLDPRLLAAPLLLVCAPLIALAWRRGGLSLGLYSLVSWNVVAAGLVCGLLRKRLDPTVPIRGRVLKELTV
jgi:glycosyltransferase involved in cell wall biosynthesis